MKISIFGLGYVGAVSVACLARDGHHVVGVDIDEQKLDIIRAGRSPIIEAGLDELISAGVEETRITVTASAAEAVAGTDLSFICVGTPASPNGSQDLSAIERLARQIGEALRDKQGHHQIVVRSTVKPGTVAERIIPLIESSAGRSGGDRFDVCFQPEFLREGSSIKDYDNPPFTVAGVSTAAAAGRLRELFGHLPCDFIVTDIRTAEMLKYACNAFHAVKVGFANEIGRLAQPLGVDSRKVMDLLCRDERLNISPAYLRPGFAFGGSCLPKDLKALLYLGKTHDVETPLLSGVMASNELHVRHAFDMVMTTSLRRIGMIGLSFKKGTDDLRESPLVTLAERFIGKGLDLKIYDPAVNLARIFGANRRYIGETIPHISSLMVGDVDELIRSSELLIVGYVDGEIIAALERGARPEQRILDLAGESSLQNIEANYRGVCW